LWCYVITTNLSHPSGLLTIDDGQMTDGGLE
jgi:hypothetical protein